MSVSMTTGSFVEIVFTYADGTTSVHGSWQVPHDSDYLALAVRSESLGHALLYEMAKQPTKTVVGVAVRAKEVSDDSR